MPIIVRFSIRVGNPAQSATADCTTRTGLGMKCARIEQDGSRGDDTNQLSALSLSGLVCMTCE